MDSSRHKHLLQSCRTCMQENDITTDVFSLLDGNTSYKDIIMACASVVIKKHENKPTKICKKCTSSLQNIFNFKCQVEKVEKLFEEQLQVKFIKKMTSPSDWFHNYESISNFIIKTESSSDSDDENDDFEAVENEIRNNQTNTSNSSSILVMDSIKKMKSDVLNISLHHNTVLKNDEHNENTFTSHKSPVKKKRELIRSKKQNEKKVIKNEVENTSNIENVISKPSNDSQKSIDTPQVKSKRSFQCDLCGKIYTKEFNLTVHMRDHTGERPYECDICQRRFKCNMLLKIHQRTHTGDKPYACKLCDKRYSRSGNLKEHMYVHMGIKRFKCQFCERPFAQYAHLFQHMKLHTGDRPFKCTYEGCDEGFITRIHLNRHLKWHAGQKDFQCTECGKCFICKFELNKHMECHSGNELIHQCSKCDKKYARKVSLAKHIRKQHK